MRSLVQTAKDTNDLLTSINGKLDTIVTAVQNTSKSEDLTPVETALTDIQKSLATLSTVVGTEDAETRPTT